MATFFETAGGLIILLVGIGMPTGMVSLLSTTLLLRKWLKIDLDSSEAARAAVLTTPVRRWIFTLHMCSYYTMIKVWIVVAVSIASGLAFLIGVLALFAVQVWISIPLAVAGAFGLFRFRLKHRAIYGAIEVPVGLAAIAAAVLPKVFEVVAPTAIGQSLFDIEPADVARLMSVAAGIYVIVRGLDNIDYGISAFDTVLSSRPYIKIRVAWELWFRRACRTADEARDKISVERQETAGNQAGGA